MTKFVMCAALNYPDFVKLPGTKSFYASEILKAGLYSHGHYSDWIAIPESSAEASKSILDKSAQFLMRIDHDGLSLWQNHFQPLLEAIDFENYGSDKLDNALESLEEMISSIEDICNERKEFKYLGRELSSFISGAHDKFREMALNVRLKILEHYEVEPIN